MSNLNIGGEAVQHDKLASAYVIADAEYGLAQIVVAVAGADPAGAMDESDERVAAWNAQAERAKLAAVKKYLKDMKAVAKEGEQTDDSEDEEGNEGGGEQTTETTTPAQPEPGTGEGQRDDPVRTLESFKQKDEADEVRALRRNVEALTKENKRLERENDKMRNAVAAAKVTLEDEAPEETNVGARLSRIEKMLGIR